MDHFFLIATNSTPLSPTHKKKLSAVAGTFPQPQKLDVLSESNYTLFLDKVLGEFTLKVSPTELDLCLGLDHKDQRTAIGEAGDVQSNFPFLNIKLNNPGELKVSSDYWGLYPYFWGTYQNSLIVTNYLPAILQFFDSELNLSSDQIEEFLTFGDLNLGKTLFPQIQCAPPGHNLYVSSIGRLLFLPKTKKPENLLGHINAIDCFYKLMKNSVQHIIQKRKIRWITLTGGADTRLIFSCLSLQQQKSTEFLFDFLASDPVHIYSDSIVVNNIVSKLGLRIRENFPNNKPALNLPFIGSQCGSMHSDLLTGLFGGELIGGTSYFVQPPIAPSSVNYHKSNLSIKRRLSEQALFSKSLQIASPLAYQFCMRATTFMSCYYDQPSWNFPYTIAQKKITPYLNTALLDIIFELPIESICKYDFYKNLFRLHAPEMLSFPFHSPIAHFHNDEFLDINLHQTKVFTESPPSTTTAPDQKLIRQLRLNIIEDSLKQMSRYAPSIEKFSSILDAL